MFKRYGQTLTWGTLTAPKLFTGTVTSYSYREMLQRQLETDEAGDNVALIQHSKKAELSFEASITNGSVDFLDLSDNSAALVVTGLPSGTLLVSRAVERWRLGQRKTASIQATHYDFAIGTGATAGVHTAYSPAQTGVTVVTPGTLLVYSTFGLGHASGVVHGLEITQEVTITEDEVTPAGTIPGATTHGYMRTISLDLLATGTKPAPGTTLALTGAPDNAGGYRIESVDEVFADKRGKMYRVGALWIPPFAS